MKKVVTNQQINEMFDALKALDNSQPRERQFAFPGKTIYALGRNLRRIRPLAEEIEETRVSLVAKHLEEQQKDPDYVKDGKPVPQLVERSKYGQAFIKEFGEILGTTQEVELFLIKVDQLDLDRNSTLPISVLANLDPILEEDDAGAEAKE